MTRLASRLALFFNIKTSAALDQVEDPREVLDYAYGQQQAHLRTVKRGLIEVAGARRHLERQHERLAARVAALEEQARRALKSGREDLARAALQRKQAALAEMRALQEQVAELGREEARLGVADQQLTQRVARFRLHRTVASARYAAAEAQVRVGEVLAGLAGTEEETELFLAVERSDEKIDRLHARAVAIDALTESGVLVHGPGEDRLDRELDELTATEAVEAELAALQRELNAQDDRVVGASEAAPQDTA
ncbi:MAG TPA: PspA/IM30 family protein [Chloroflexota bacterium]|nr:PspA/IM30 family protein [Chloroflexota bacterium]